MTTTAISNTLFVAVLFATLLDGAADKAALAARATLHPLASIRTPLVRLGDVADISAESRQETARIGAVVLTTAPVPGDVRHLRSAQVRDLAAAQGIDVSDLEIDGAEVVELRRGADIATQDVSGRGGTSDDATPDRAISPTEQITLQRSLQAYLQRVTGHPLWKVELLTTEAPLDRLTNGEGQWCIDGGRDPWNGRQTFRLVAPMGQAPITLQARVTRQQTAVVVVRAIDRGGIVRASDVEWRPIDGALPGMAISTIEAAIGKEARQGLRPGALLLSNQLRAPVVVRRGETVTVVARAAGVSVKTLAVARQDGSVGELVQVDVIDGAKREQLFARVSGPRQLEVFAAGVHTDELTPGTTLASSPYAEAR